MQIFLKFRGNDIILPMANQYPIQSLIYRMIASDHAYTDFLHDTGYQTGRKTFKLFTFGDLWGRYEIRDGMLCFGNRFTLQLRSPQMDFVSALLKNIRCGDTFRLCENPLVLDDIRMEDRHVTQSEIRIKTVSPITVYTTTEDRKTRYFSPNESEFYAAVAANAYDKSVHLRNRGDGILRITPLGTYTEQNKVVTRYKGVYITGWMGTFVLSADPVLLDFLYNTGLGAKNAQGFGMFEMI